MPQMIAILPFTIFFTLLFTSTTSQPCTLKTTVLYLNLSTRQNVTLVLHCSHNFMQNNSLIVETPSFLQPEIINNCSQSVEGSSCILSEIIGHDSCADKYKATQITSQTDEIVVTMSLNSTSVIAGQIYVTILQIHEMFVRVITNPLNFDSNNSIVRRDTRITKNATNYHFQLNFGGFYVTDQQFQIKIKYFDTLNITTPVATKFVYANRTVTHDLHMVVGSGNVISIPLMSGSRWLRGLNKVVFNLKFNNANIGTFAMGIELLDVKCHRLWAYGIYQFVNSDNLQDEFTQDRIMHIKLQKPVKLSVGVYRLPFSQYNQTTTRISILKEDNTNRTITWKGQSYDPVTVTQTQSRNSVEYTVNNQSTTMQFNSPALEDTSQLTIFQIDKVTFDINSEMLSRIQVQVITANGQSIFKYSWVVHMIKYRAPLDNLSITASGATNNRTLNVSVTLNKNDFNRQIAYGILYLPPTMMVIPCMLTGVNVCDYATCQLQQNGTSIKVYFQDPTLYTKKFYIKETLYLHMKANASMGGFRFAIVNLRGEVAQVSTITTGGDKYPGCQTKNYLYMTAESVDCFSCLEQCSQCSSKTNCLACSQGFQINGSVCQVAISATNSSDNSESNNIVHEPVSNTNDITVTGPIVNKILPNTLTLFLLTVIAFASKMVFKKTIVRAVVVSFAGIVEVVSWLVLLLFLAKTEEPSTLETIATYTIITALGLNLCFNGAGLIIFQKQIWEDRAVQSYLVKMGGDINFWMASCWLSLTLITSHKAVEMLFSELFNFPCFKFKVSSISKMSHQDYTRYFSIIPSLIAIMASVVLTFSSIGKTFDNDLFRSMVDLVIVSVAGTASGYFVTVREQGDYVIKKEKRGQIIQDQSRQAVSADISDCGRFQKMLRVGKTPFSSNHKQSKKMSPLAEDAISRQTIAVLVKPFDEVAETEVNLNQKDDFDDRMTNLNDTRVTTRVNITRQKKAIAEIGKDGGEEYSSNLSKRTNRPANLPMSRRNRRVKAKFIDDVEDLRQKIEHKLSPSQVILTRCVKKINQIFNKLVIQQKEVVSLNQNIVSQSLRHTLADKISAIMNFSVKDKWQLDSQDLQILQNIQSAVHLLNQKAVQVQDMVRYIDLFESGETEKENTPIDNMRDVRGSSKYNSKKFRGGSKRRASHDIKPKVFLQCGDYYPDVADFLSRIAGDAGNEEELEQIEQFKQNYESQIHPHMTKEANISRPIVEQSSKKDKVDESLFVKYIQQNQPESKPIQKQSSVLQPSKIMPTRQMSLDIGSMSSIGNIEEQGSERVEYIETNRNGDEFFYDFDSVMREGNMELGEREQYIRREQSEGETPAKPAISHKIVESRIILGSGKQNNFFSSYQSKSMLPPIESEVVKRICKKDVPVPKSFRSRILEPIELASKRQDNESVVSRKGSAVSGKGSVVSGKGSIERRRSCSRQCCKHKNDN